MILAKVLGPVVATQKHEALKGRTLYVVQPIDKNKNAKGNTFLALDSVQARVGDLVLINREGGSCRQILQNDLAPINALICGIVDQLDI
ncbi:MAG: EutN/CcmL family microcompartment protein [Deltaproteobacteria bacterium]|nr:EutN/CcmL family microcompartment protein [Deltaproteobacteria bacterium]MBI3017492.1 EutN/CcmL family microcompartment protein [Deltaproteobacteria bacterium]